MGEGSIRCGYYHSQWLNMMGSSKQTDVEYETAKCWENEDKDAEIHRLKEEIAKLKRAASVRNHQRLPLVPEHHVASLRPVQGRCKSVNGRHCGVPMLRFSRMASA